MVVTLIVDVYDNVFCADDAIFNIDDDRQTDRQINDDEHFVLYRVFYDGNEKNNGPPVYVGRTKQLLPDRIREHLFHSKFRKTFDVDRVSCVQFAQLDSEADMNLYEIYYILKDKPILNKDDKTQDDLTQDYLPELVWKDAYLPLWDKWKDKVHQELKEIEWDKNEIQRLKEERMRVRWDESLKESYKNALLDDFDRRIDELKKNVK